MRIAALDIGTNTVLLLVADRQADGSLLPVAERATITRLGQDVDRTHRLASAAVERTRTCLESYASSLHELHAERVGVVGTSAMRDSEGGRELRDYVRSLLGVDVRVLTGVEEARLTFRGALSGLAMNTSREVAVFDVGGGSTEVVVGKFTAGEPIVSFADSFDVGSVRLTERHGEDWLAIRRATRNAFASVPPLPSDRSPVGVAGTMTTLAAVSLGLTTYEGTRVHGHSMSVEELEKVVGRLASLDVESRRRVPGMEPGRADVIVAGGFLAIALMRHWQARAVEISDRGVRWGLAEELAAS